jgi:hypothetical protein
MFTVLHRGADGTEKLYEAETVTRFPPECEESIPALGEIRLGGVKIDEIPGQTVTLAIKKPFGAVFVMNRFGATVARHLA